MQIRKMHLSDIPAFSRILMASWRLGRTPQMSRRGQKVAGLLYILSVLEESETVWTAVEKAPVGFVGYGIGRRKKIYSWLQKLIMALLPAADRKFYQEYNTYCCYGPLHASANKAEVTILIVSPEYYGCGLGKQLTDMAETAAKQKGCQSIFALTDTSCHWHFYEKQGFVKVFERAEKGMEMKACQNYLYIFQKQLSA